MTPNEARRAHDIGDVCDRLWSQDYFGLTPALRSKNTRRVTPNPNSSHQETDND